MTSHRNQRGRLQCRRCEWRIDDVFEDVATERNNYRLFPCRRRSELLQRRTAGRRRELLSGGQVRSEAHVQCSVDVAATQRWEELGLRKTLGENSDCRFDGGR